MPKKKPFIDKRSAASFHVVHQPSSSGAALTADAALAAAATEDITSSIAAVSLLRHTHDASSAPPPASTSRYLFQPSRSTTRIPAGFPADLLLSAHAAQLEAMDAADRRVKRRRERDSQDAALLPHEYDYSSHMREMGGGTFIAATPSREAGGGAAGGSKRERRATAPAADADVRAQQPRVPDALDAEIDWRLVREAEREADRLRARLGRAGQAATMPADLLAALDERAGETATAAGEEEAAAVPAGFDELEDDWVLRAMQASADAQQDDQGEADEKEDGEEEEQVVWGEEDDGDDSGLQWDEKAMEGKEAPNALRQQRRRRQQAGSLTAAKDGQDEEDGEDEAEYAEDDDSEEWEEEGEEADPGVESLLSSAPLAPSSASSSGGLDADFDRLLSEYGDADIGGLDDLDEAEVSGPLPLSSFAAAIDSFLSRQQRPVTEGGAVLVMDDRERELLRRRMQRRLAAMQREDGAAALSAEEAEDWLPAVYRSAVKDDWDVESIVSTLSNTENLPTAIADSSSSRSSSRAVAAGRQSAIAAAISQSATQLQQAAAAAAATAEDGEAASDESGVRNLGEARPRGETAEERRLRKAAAKSERRDVRQRKKQLRRLYSSMQAQQHARQTMSSKDNPPAIRL